MGTGAAWCVLHSDFSLSLRVPWIYLYGSHCGSAGQWLSEEMGKAVCGPALGLLGKC